MLRSASIGLSSLLVILALAHDAAAQGDRVHLLSRFNAYDGAGSSGFDYNDVFGYTDAGGREVAILGCYGGTSFVETTDPFNPVELKFIARNGSIWSDMAVWQDYVYVVTEAGGGLQIIDVSDLSNINLVTTWTGGFNSAHSLWIDTTAGIAYACGTNAGLQIIDLANPTAPTIITNYTTQYVHELTAQNGLANFSEIYAGRYRLADVSALPTITILDTITTPSAFTHSTTIDDTDSFVGMTDEVTSARFVLYDITDPYNITQRSTFVENPDGIIHNVFLDHGVVQLSAYAEGYVALDVRDPDHPIRLGSYDTWPGATGGYHAAWGIYPQPSGTVYISNIEDGLWVLCRANRIDHTPLPDTLDETGPYVVVATITSSSAGGGLTGATLEYTTDDGATSTQVSLAPTGNPDEWSASIPGQLHGKTVQYWLRATDSLGTSNLPAVADGRFVFSVGARTSRYLENFDGATDAGWTHGRVSGTDDWARGTPARKQLDPYRTTSGANCFGNDLGNSTDGLYPSSSDNWLESPAIDLSASRRTRLRFNRWLRVDDSALDRARVLVNGTEIWRNPTNGGSLQTLDPEWATMDFDVSALADGVAATRVRFELKSNGSGEYGGWNVDDVEIYSVSSCRDAEDYGAGTAGSGGYVPVLSTVGDPTLGNLAFEIDGSQIRGGAACLLAVGVARNDYFVKGITLLVDLAPPAFFIPVVASGPAGSPGVGTFALFEEIDDDPALDGIEIDMQILVADPANPKKLAASQGRAVWLCQ